MDKKIILNRMKHNPFFIIGSIVIVFLLVSVFLRKNVLLSAKIPRCRSHWELEKYTLDKIIILGGNKP